MDQPLWTSRYGTSKKKFESLKKFCTNLPIMIQLQYQQLDRHKMIYQYDATEIYNVPQMNLTSLEDMGKSIES